MEGTVQSTINVGLQWKNKLLLDKPSPRRRVLGDLVLKMNSEGLHRAWTLPTRFSKRSVYNILESPVIMDPIQCQHMGIRAEGATSEVNQPTECLRPSLETSSNSKLSVREQARQFEQNALGDIKITKSWEGKDTSNCNEKCTEKKSLIKDLLCQNSPLPPETQDSLALPTHQSATFPSILITASDCSEDISPPPTRKPTPPLARKSVTPCQTFKTSENEQVIPNLIPDPPNIPPPCPPPTTSPSFTPTQPSLLTRPPEVTCPTPPPPPLPAPSLPPSFSPILPTPPPPPLPQTLLTPSHSQVSLSSLAPTPSSIRKKLFKVPEASKSDAGPRRELKGILKNIQNLADIEKSVANMYTQIDKGNPLSKQVPKPKSLVPTDTQNADILNPHEKLNGNLSSVVGELEKRFPSQSTAL
ncbi:protocadherin-15-like [Pyxicephalus adspersus]|uniref:protocadherin-15-like n=1 Tax=Pyxicephalus adspersus TaxID=30357 RepID=UPI003B5BF6EA